MKEFSMEEFDPLDMLTDTQRAELYVSRDNVPWELIKKNCLREKDVVVAYMKNHSSNDLLHSGFHIDITQDGFLSDMEFITNVIENLDAGYNKDNLNRLLKLSTAEIIKKNMRTMEYEDPEHYTDDPEYWKAQARICLEDYANTLEERNNELSKKVQVLDEIMNCEVPGLEGTKKSDNYKRCNIGFGAKF